MSDKIIAKIKYISEPDSNFKWIVDEDDPSGTIDIGDWMTDGLDSEQILGWFANIDYGKNIISIIGELEESSLAEFDSDIDAWSIYDAIQRLEETFGIGWVEKSLTDSNGEDIS